MRETDKSTFTVEGHTSIFD